MTERRNDKDHDRAARDARLKALYSRAGDVEPDSGLDRIVRARADEAVRARRSSNRLPWLGGLVTASVAVVAIAVMLQQTPPGEPLPRTLAPQEPGGPEAYMAPSMGAQFMEKAADEGDRARPESARTQSSAPPHARSVAAPDAMQDRATDADASMEERRSRHDDFVAEQAGIAVEHAREVATEIIEDPDRILERIKTMIERDEMQRARELLETFRRGFPEHNIPEEIEQALAPPD